MDSDDIQELSTEFIRQSIEDMNLKDKDSESSDSEESAQEESKTD